MARPNWKARHVRTLAELPEKLIKGRAYFIDDEGIILIDHGDKRGVQIYGNRPGIQGQPGEPVPQIFADLESLSRAAINNASTLNYEIQSRRKSQEIEKNFRLESEQNLQNQIDSLVKAILNQAATLNAENQNRKELKSNLQEQINSLIKGLLTQSANEQNLREESDSKLQTQIDTLAKASLSQSQAIKSINDNHKQNFANEQETRKESDSKLQIQIDTLAKAIIMLADALRHTREFYSEKIKTLWELTGGKKIEQINSMLSDVYNDLDTQNDEIGSLNDDFTDKINSMLSDVYDESDSHDDAINNLTQSQIDAMNEILNEIYG